MVVYYPSIVVNFRLRFDETLQIQEPIPEPQLSEGEVDAISGADQLNQPVDLVVNRGDFNLSQIMNRIPRSASIEMPGIRQAGKFSIDIDFRELPIDPRLLRSAGVEIYQGTVNPQDFATGVVTQSEDGTRVSILNIADREPDMIGFVDVWRTIYNDRGSAVHIEGRDPRGILLDSPFNPALFDSVDIRKPLDVVIRGILKSHPIGKVLDKTFFLLVESGEWPDGVIPVPVDTKGLIRPRRKADGMGANSSTGTAGANYWDVITNLCNYVGAVPYFRGRNLRIRPARSIVTQVRPTSSARSPFRPGGLPGPRQDDNSEDFFVRKMIFGRNIDELSFERKYTGTKVPVIEVVSLDHSSDIRGPGKLRAVQWPPKDKEKARINGVLPSGDASQTDIQRFPIPGITSERQQEEIAKNLYEEIGRQEMGGVCSTRDLASFKGDNSDPDLLSLKPGDAVEFSVDIRALGSNAPLISEFTDHHRLSFNEQIVAVKKALSGKALAADDNLLRALVATSRSSILGILNYFRSSNIKYTWSEGGKVRISFDFHNFQVIRSDITDRLKELTGTPVINKERRRRRRKERQPRSNPARRNG